MSKLAWVGAALISVVGANASIRLGEDGREYPNEIFHPAGHLLTEKVTDTYARRCALSFPFHY